MEGHDTARRRSTVLSEHHSFSFLRALPGFPGAKGGLLRLIFGLLRDASPRAQWPSLVFADAFSGSGAVALAAKAFGFRAVIANDIAERAAITSRALIANSTVHLLPPTVLRLCEPAAPSGAAAPALLARLAPRLRVFFEQAWEHLRGGTFSGVERDLISLLLMKLLCRTFPMGLPGATDAPRIVEGDYDRVTSPRLAHYLSAEARVLRPTALLRAADDINVAIMPGNGQAFRLDVFDFLARLEADIVYLDSPYPATQAYEGAFALLDDFLGAEPLPRSPFSSRRPPLDELLDACRRIPVLILSLNNALLDEAAVEALVARHRSVRRLLSVPYRHYGPIAAEEKNKRNKEFLVLGVL